MALTTRYARTEPLRTEIDTLKGPTVLEFGTDWCGFCQAAQPLLAAAFKTHPDLRHLKIEDGPGRPLGRSFRIKLWPTLIFLTDDKEVERLVRPRDADSIANALAKIDRSAAGL